MRYNRVYLLLLVLAIMLLSPEYLRAAGESPSKAANPQELAEGKWIYETNCAICHGISGDGRGMAAHMFVTQPRDLTTGVFKFRSTPSGSLPTDTDLIRTITNGLKGTPMVAQRHLTKEQVRAVVTYIKTFSKRFAEEPTTPAIDLVDAPPGDAAILARGKELYREAGCVDCHGAQGLGDGSSAGDLKDAWGHPAKPGDLTTPLKRGSTARAIHQTLITGLDGTPMPSYQDALTEEQLWTLAFYVASLNKGILSSQQRQEQTRGQHVLRMHGPGTRGGMMRGPRRGTR